MSVMDVWIVSLLFDLLYPLALQPINHVLMPSTLAMYKKSPTTHKIA
jgi:hypothetical protein